MIVEVKERRGSRIPRHDRIAALKISLRKTPQDKAKKLSSNMKQSLPHLSALRAGRSISKCDKPGIDLTIHDVNDKIEAL